MCIIVSMSVVDLVVIPFAFYCCYFFSFANLFCACTVLLFVLFKKKKLVGVVDDVEINLINV